MITQTLTLTDFLLARITENEADARLCAEMFPPPWELSDRGWRVRIYAGDVPVEDLMLDDPAATTARNPVVMEVEPDRHIEDPRWLSERVQHVVNFDPAHVLAECEAKRRIVEYATGQHTGSIEGLEIMQILATVYADHPDYREEWRP